MFSCSVPTPHCIFFTFSLNKAQMGIFVLERRKAQGFFPKSFSYQRPRECGHFLPAVFPWIITEDFTEESTYDINDVVQADSTDAPLVKRSGRQKCPFVLLWIIALDLGGKTQLWEHEFTSSPCLGESDIH